jgi:hypothetical protein
MESYALFIDAAYAINSFRNDRIDNLRMDYLKLRYFLDEELGCHMDEGYFFNACPDSKCDKLHHYLESTATPDSPAIRVQNYPNLQKRMLFWPDHLGGGPVMHPTIPDTQYCQTIQKQVDVGLVWTLGQSFNRRKWKNLVLLAGDVDFAEPITQLVNIFGVNLYLVGTQDSISPKITAQARKLFNSDDPAIRERISR